MSLFTPTVVEGTQLFQSDFPDGMDFFIDQINGVSRAKTWVPQSIKIVFKGDKGGQRVKSDASFLNLCANAIVLRAEGAERIGSFLRQHGELLPLACKEDKLFVFNPTQIVDALDEKKSDIWRFGDGRLISVRKYVFRSAALAGADLFKIPNLRLSPVFFSEAAMNRWVDSGISGLVFKNVN